MSHSFTENLIAFVKAHEGQWIDAIRFEQFGRQAWRTRISNARIRLQASGDGTIENRVLHVGRIKRSQYAYFAKKKPEIQSLSWDNSRDATVLETPTASLTTNRAREARSHG